MSTTIYAEVVISKKGRIRHPDGGWVEALVRPKTGRDILQQVGKCMDAGGYVDVTTTLDEITNTERMSATLHWPEEGHQNE